MTYKRTKILALVLGMTCSLVFVSLAQAQATTDQAAPAASSDTSKQSQKAQKKAERKARRAKKNAELSTLEKNGYSPAGDQHNYPQNIQNAEKKSNPKGGGAATPASAP